MKRTDETTGKQGKGTQVTAIPARSSVAADGTVTDGAARLRDVPTGDVVEKLGVSRQSVHRWRTGEKVPGPAARAKLQALFGIPVATWGAVMPAEPAPVAGPVAEVIAAGIPTTLADALAHLDRIRKAYQAHGLTTSELAKLYSEETKTLSLRARLEKEAELTEDRIVRDHPFWLRLKLTVLAALKPHPQATRDVIAALAQVESP